MGLSSSLKPFPNFPPLSELYKEKNLPHQICKIKRIFYRIKGNPKSILMILLIQNFNPTDRKTK
jgi:hypothetical protein